MKIQKIETYLLKCELDDLTFWSSQCSFSHRKSLVVKITTDSGLVGLGEGGQYGPGEQVSTVVHKVFAPMLMGVSFDQIDVLWDKMYCKIRDYARKGPAIEAMSAIDIALWDLLGKQLSKPVYSLLGGAFRKELTCYATGLYYRGKEIPSLDEELISLKSEAENYVNDGFSAVKMKIGLMTPREDILRMQRVREIIGPDRQLFVDANHAYNVHTAKMLIKPMAELDVYWFEEPVVPEDRSGYRELKESSPFAIAGGECEYTRYGFVNWFKDKAMDICQPDLCCAGGIGEVKRIATIANAHGVTCIPHVWGSGIALAAGVQLLATLPPFPYTARECAPFNAPILEYDSNPNPLRTDLLSTPLAPKDGKIKVPEAPGLGISINEEAFENYTVSQDLSELSL
ncbi:MAG: mandelate racemase/muconate lactonizing enzyme family protein [Planctomycetes bacterium]|nr:mandelate racemase/muconate lactonizing enzyme family protein [Planctomycetota bacterium]